MHYTLDLGRDHVALRPQKRVCLLGTGTEWEGDERVKARPRSRPKKTGETVDRRQNNGSVKTVDLHIQVHAQSLLLSAVPWISEDRLLVAAVLPATLWTLLMAPNEQNRENKSGWMTHIHHT